MADHFRGDPTPAMTKADYERFVERHGRTPTWPPMHSKGPSNGRHVGEPITNQPELELTAA